MGSFLLEEGKKQGSDPSYIQWDNDRISTLALAQYEENEEHSFCFYRKHTADDCLVAPLNPAFEFALILHFGAIDGLPSLKEVETRIRESGWSLTRNKTE